MTYTTAYVLGRSRSRSYRALKKIRKLLDALLITVCIAAITLAAVLLLAEKSLRLLLEYWPIK